MTVWKCEVKNTHHIYIKQLNFSTKFLILFLPFCNYSILPWDWRRISPFSGYTIREMGSIVQNNRLANCSASFGAQDVLLLVLLSQLHHHNLCNWRQQFFKHSAELTFPLVEAFLAIKPFSLMNVWWRVLALQNDWGDTVVASKHDKMIKLAEVKNWVVQKNGSVGEKKTV